jgi:hypothetical protein
MQKCCDASNTYLTHEGYKLAAKPHFQTYIYANSGMRETHTHYSRNSEKDFH